MSVRRVAPTDRRWVDVGRGAGGLIGVLLLVAGIPVALISWVGWPLPAEVPSLDEVSTALSNADISDAFLIKSLALVCWFVWIELMTSLIVEAIAYARGQEAGRVPFGGGMQRTAARLVASVALLGALTTAKGAPEAAELVLRPLTSGAPSADLMVHEETGPTQTEPAAVAEKEAQEVQNPIYEVQPRDTLWGIAEKHLHDPFRWPEIYELNKDKIQPDGRVLTDPDVIHPDWRLEMPPDAVGLDDPEPPPDTAPQDAGPDIPDEPDPEPEPEPDDGPGGGDGELASGGMTVLDIGQQEPEVEYAAGDGGMVLLPDEAAPDYTESVAPELGLPVVDLDDEVAGPESPARGGAFIESIEDWHG